jgi:sigma-B regulation protein RsbU (phosphoserine phosphatase)
LSIRQDGAVEWLDAPAPVLGPFKDMNFPAKKFALGRGDLLVLYSDGITEAERQGEEFGRDRLAQHLVAVRTRSAAQIRAAVIEAVEAFAGKGPQHDDITLLIVKRIGTAPFP